MSVRERWNLRHGERAHEPPGPPTAWLAGHRSVLEALGGGRALDIAAGRGRNALFLAELGFEVDAVDVSDVACEAVARHARERGLAVDALRRDAVAEGFPHPPYAAIVNVAFLDRALFEPIEAALAPGGVLVFETFTRDHVERAGGRLDPAHLLEPGELRAAFARLEVLDHREAVVPRELGEGHRGVASLVARKPCA